MVRVLNLTNDLTRLLVLPYHFYLFFDKNEIVQFKI